MAGGAPIGVFDSGIGGLTVVAALRRALPNESILYLGDTARVPYGTKSAAVVRRYALSCADFLVREQAKIVVVACNTATAHALDALAQHLDRPVVGVIEPGARLAARLTKSGRVGVIATEGTVASGSYQQALVNARSDLEVFAVACPLFVPLAEEGLFDHPATRLLAQEYLEPLAAKNIDTLVLGCTHYPLLRSAIQRVTGDGVQLVDSATAVAQHTAQLLRAHGLEAEERRVADRFFATDATERFLRVGRAFLADSIHDVRRVEL